MRPCARRRGVLPARRRPGARRLGAPPGDRRARRRRRRARARAAPPDAAAGSRCAAARAPRPAPPRARCASRRARRSTASRSPTSRSSPRRARAPTAAGGAGRRRRWRSRCATLRRDFPYDLVHAHNAVPAGEAVRRAGRSTAARRLRPRRRRLPHRARLGRGRAGRARGARDARGSCSPTAPAIEQRCRVLGARDDARRAPRHRPARRARRALRRPDGRHDRPPHRAQAPRRRAARDRRCCATPPAAALPGHRRRARARRAATRSPPSSASPTASSSPASCPTTQALARTRRAWLLAMPSTDEAFGVAYVEAMAGGLPAIGARRRARPGGDPSRRRRPRARRARRRRRRSPRRIDAPRSATPTRSRSAGEQARATVAARRSRGRRCGAATVAAYEDALAGPGPSAPGARDEARPVRHQPRAARARRRVRGAAPPRAARARDLRRALVARDRRGRRSRRAAPLRRAARDPRARRLGRLRRRRLRHGRARRPAGGLAGGAQRARAVRAVDRAVGASAHAGARRRRVRRCSPRCTATPTRSSPTGRTSRPSRALAGRATCTSRRRPSTTRSGAQRVDADAHGALQRGVSRTAEPGKRRRGAPGRLAFVRFRSNRRARPRRRGIRAPPEPRRRRGRLRRPQPPEQVRNFLAAADVLVIPSLRTRSFREPWGLVANEAMNQSTPIIATDEVGAVAGGLVRHERNGLVVPAGDARRWPAALRRLHDDAAAARDGSARTPAATSPPTPSTRGRPGFCSRARLATVIVMRKLAQHRSLTLLALLVVDARRRSAPGKTVINDCTDDEVLSKTYTQKEYRDALAKLPADADQYGNCRDIIARAQEAAATKGGSKGSRRRRDSSAGATTAAAPAAARRPSTAAGRRPARRCLARGSRRGGRCRAPAVRCGRRGRARVDRGRRRPRRPAPTASPACRPR